MESSGEAGTDLYLTGPGPPAYLIHLFTNQKMGDNMRYIQYKQYGVFLVFAIWAAFGFAYPGTPIPIALNAISKVLCFVTAITMFLPLKGTAAQEKVLL
jgi:hypothetical protein